METFEWLKPQPLWGELDQSDATAVRGPVIARFDSDAFMERFLEHVESGSLANIELTTAGQRLFLPFHQRYHLVLASLVCRRLGFPDRALDVKSGEKAGFVLRRQGAGGLSEKAWVPGAGWVALTDEDALGSSSGANEEVLPLVRSQIGGRCVWHGFVPLAASESEAADGSKLTKFGTKPSAHRYVLRCVYRRPQCRITPTVISAPSPSFEVSAFLDPSAPQRTIEIGIDVPETFSAVKQTVKFKLGSMARGVVGNSVSRLPDDFPVVDATGLDCDSPSLSIPWITLVAFILLIIITSILWPIFMLFALPLGLLLPGGSLCPDPQIPQREE